MSVLPALSSAPLLPCLFMSLASLTLSLSQTVCLSLPPLSWLHPKACAPTLNAWINLPISLNPWGEEQEEPAKGRQQPQSLKEAVSSQLGLGGLRPRISHLPSGL